MIEMSKPCFRTIGIEESIPLVLQMYLWQLVFEVKKDRDYLQVFELKEEEIENGKVQVIIHSQEEPERSNTYYLTSPDPIISRIYIIEDSSYFTMLLSSEY